MRESILKSYNRRTLNPTKTKSSEHECLIGLGLRLMCINVQRASVCTMYFYSDVPNVRDDVGSVRSLKLLYTLTEMYHRDALQAMVTSNKTYSC